MIHLVTYADERMTKAKKQCIKSALANGINSFNDWCKERLTDTDFYRQNKETLDQERGAGYWLWKPYICYDAILRLNDGDTLIYADAGVEFIAPVFNIINRMEEDIFFFTNGHKHKEWCKTDVTSLINGWKPFSQQDQEHKQVQASVIFFKVNQITRDFIKEWLLWCQMPGLIDDSPSKEPNCKTFSEHRHDQAILTSLQIKYGYKLHWWPTQYSEHIRVEGDTYPVLFNHHRKRNEDY